MLGLMDGWRGGQLGGWVKKFSETTANFLTRQPVGVDRPGDQDLVLLEFGSFPGRAGA